MYISYVLAGGVMGLSSAPRVEPDGFEGDIFLVGYLLVSMNNDTRSCDG